MNKFFNDCFKDDDFIGGISEATKGYKVMVTTGTILHRNDRDNKLMGKLIKLKKIELNKPYIVRRLEIGTSRSEVYLEGIEEGINSVCFIDYKDNDMKVKDIYNQQCFTKSFIERMTLSKNNRLELFNEDLFGWIQSYCKFKCNLEIDDIDEVIDCDCFITGMNKAIIKLSFLETIIDREME
jgi:hypothetical protein